MPIEVFGSAASQVGGRRTERTNRLVITEMSCEEEAGGYPALFAIDT
jgi:hypothetical protein